MQACCSLQNDLYANKKGSLSSEPEWVAGHGGVCLEFLGEERHGAALGADVGRDSDGFLVRLAEVIVMRIFRFFLDVSYTGCTSDILMRTTTKVSVRPEGVQTAGYWGHNQMFLPWMVVSFGWMV